MWVYFSYTRNVVLKCFTCTCEVKNWNALLFVTFIAIFNMQMIVLHCSVMLWYSTHLQLSLFLHSVKQLTFCRHGHHCCHWDYIHLVLCRWRFIIMNAEKFELRNVNCLKSLILLFLFTEQSLFLEGQILCMLRMHLDMMQTFSG
jgi:hypothetical protein